MISLLGAAAFSSVLTGCYTLRPVKTGVLPPAGKEVAFDVTDAGRLALGGLVGPEIGQLEGRLVSSENGEYLMAVYGVHYLRGGEQAWTGERVSLRQDWVSTVYEKKISPGRTVALAAISVGAFAYVVKRVVNPGSPSPIIDPTGGGNQLIRP